MMDYEVFKEIVMEQFKNYMPENFKDFQLNVQPINKVNRTLDGLTLLPPEPRNYEASPTLYIDYMYEDYKKSGDFREVLERMASEFTEAFNEMSLNTSQFGFQNVQDHIVMNLVNTKQNEQLLQEVPHREFQDLSIIYRYVADEDRGRMASALVNNSFAERLGMNEQELYEAAVINTKKLFPPVTLNMEEIMREILMGSGLAESEISMFIAENSGGPAMYVISNEQKVNGAVSMLYENELHKLSEKLEGDLYIIPSSIHEVIAVSADLCNPNELAEMVADVNMDKVALEERLSNQVYHYDKDLRKLSLATDTPNKRLDGIESEPSSAHENKQSR